jgi:adenylate cyclase
MRFAASATWLPLVTPLAVQAPLALFGGLLWQFVQERRGRERLHELLRDVLSPAVIDHLLNQFRTVAGAGRELYGTFVLTDIEGFVQVAGGQTPARTSDMLNDYFGLIFPPVEAHGGSVSDIVGDAMLAFWATPSPEAAARAAACRAALEIAALTRRPDALPGWPHLPTRIGLHAGPIALARVGGSRHHEYRAVGDAVNTVSRIEALGRHLGVKLLASEAAVEGLDDLLTRPLGRFLLAGRSAPLGVCELLGRAGGASDEQRRLGAEFAIALGAFAARRWDDATAEWIAILQRHPHDGPSRFYLARTRRLAAEPPPDSWDGVVCMDSK